MTDTDPRYCRQLIGHGDAFQRLYAAHDSGRMPHGWVVTGPRGVGKASLVWKFVKELLAREAYDAANPGLSFDLPAAINPATDATEMDEATLARIERGGHGGVLDISRGLDKAGNPSGRITIDQIRRLGPFFGNSSAEGGWRVAIIDDADFMTRDAANTLLKTLEEPPERSLIFLITQSHTRLLPTIISRCRRLSVSSLSSQQMNDWFEAHHPDISTNDRSELTRLASGAPGRVLALIAAGGVSLHHDLTRLLENPTDQACQRFADKLTPASMLPMYELCRSMILDWIAVQARGAARAADHGHHVSNRLDRWAELWEKTAQEFAKGEALNLDRRQSLMQLFREVAALKSSG